MPATEQLVVEVFVRELGRSRDFYLGLGFELLRESHGFAELAWEGHRFFLDERSGLPLQPAMLRANVRIMVPDVDAHWQKLQAAGVPVVAPIADREYGLRDFTVRDPDGFGVRFAGLLSNAAPL